MTLYDVRVRGCDDSTRLTLKLTPRQADFVRDLADRVTRSSETGCQPTMQIEPHVHDDDCPEDHR